ncbi:MAG: mechanosensitive ion channel domain-containing protein [Polyangiales bacterium]
MNQILRLICLLTVASIVQLAPKLTIAQSDAGAGDADLSAPEPGEAIVDAGAPEPPTEIASDAKRVVRIRQVITLDKQRLRWLRSELRTRTSWFERLAEGMTDVALERNAKKEALEALEPDSEEALALKEELLELEQDYELYDTQTDLALNSERTVREQISAMEEKIANDENVLGKLTGEISAAPPAEVEAPAGQPTTPAVSEKTPGLPMPVAVPSPPAAAAPDPKKTSSAMTAAQLQANNALERTEQEVEVAKLALSDFVERKRALQRQIEFEQGLAKSDAEEAANLRRALETSEARLAKRRAAGVSAERIQRRERNNESLRRMIEESARAGEARAKYIESLLERMVHLDEAKLRVTDEVDQKQEEAAKARRSMLWLESPIHPKNVQHWVKERGLRILLVMLAAFSLLVFVQLSAQRIARTLVGRRRGSRSTGTGRADTLAFSFRSVSRVLIVIFGTLLVLQEAGVDIKTVLGGAALLGVAVAFGAQDLMRDYFSGFLILAEDQYQLGDLVTIRGVTGTVESVNMRVTVLRDLEGRVHFIPNGNIDHVTNRTYAWGRPVFEIPIGFHEDVDMVMETLVQVAAELGEDPNWHGKVIGAPDMLGVDKFTDYGMVIKFMVKTQPDQLFAVRREMLRRISKRFHELGIRITVPQRMLVRGEENEPQA